MIFCIFIGSLFVLQPQFIHGLTISSSKAALNCYITGGLYGLVFFIAVVSLRKKYATRRDLIQGEHRQSYQMLEPFDFDYEDHMIEGHGIGLTT